MKRKRILITIDDDRFKPWETGTVARALHYAIQRALTGQSYARSHGLLAVEVIPEDDRVADVERRAEYRGYQQAERDIAGWLRTVGKIRTGAAIAEQRHRCAGVSDFPPEEPAQKSPSGKI